MRPEGHVEGLWGKGLRTDYHRVVGTSPLSFERNDESHKVAFEGLVDISRLHWQGYSHLRRHVRSCARR